jgi:hypothetical protein
LIPAPGCVVMLLEEAAEDDMDDGGCDGYWLLYWRMC